MKSNEEEIFYSSSTTYLLYLIHRSSLKEQLLPLGHTVYAEFLAVTLIWRFGELNLKRQIKMPPI